MSKFKERAKDFAASGLNKLPTNANLFLRYMTGLGNRNLDFSDEYLTDVREETKSADLDSARFDREMRDELGRPTVDLPRITADGKFESPTISKFRPFSSFTFPSDDPRSGPVNPYGGLNKNVIQTLGRFQSKVNLDSKTVNIKDRFDMVNPEEDPDLVSGKIQPKKALRSFISALRGVGKGDQYGFEFSPKTEFARGLMYALPVKPKGFDINVDIPMKGDIKGRETYK
tara:strand:+ start:411 stop:1097 length:687 start_codon:yes stop_codon:yes gene_type:complete